MVGLNNTSRVTEEFEELEQSVSDQYFSTLRRLFDKDQPNKQRDNFFTSLMFALGSKFYIEESSFNQNFVNLTNHIVENLEPIEGFQAYPKGTGVYYKDKNSPDNSTVILANNNTVASEDKNPKIQTMFNMAYLAQFNKNFIDNGVDLDGDIYQRTILQLSIDYMNHTRNGEDLINVNQPLESFIQSEEDVKNYQRAVKDFMEFAKTLPKLSPPENNNTAETSGPSIHTGSSQTQQPKNSGETTQPKTVEPKPAEPEVSADEIDYGDIETPEDPLESGLSDEPNPGIDNTNHDDIIAADEQKIKALVKGIEEKQRCPSLAKTFEEINYCQRIAREKVRGAIYSKTSTLNSNDPYVYSFLKMALDEANKGKPEEKQLKMKEDKPLSQYAVRDWHRGNEHNKV